MFHALRFAALVALAVAGLTPAASAQIFNQYQVVPSETFFLPQGDPTPENRGTALFDNLADGRLLVLSTAIPDPSDPFAAGTPELYVETAVSSRTWSYLGNLPLALGASWPSFGGAFLSISPDGSRVAVGDNAFAEQHVGVFTTADLLTSGPAAMPIDWFPAAHSGGAWFDNRQLALVYGDFVTSSVSVLDTDSNVTMPINNDVVTGVGGGSSSIAFDADGNLYTGNGFDTSPGGSVTGTIRKFAKDGPDGWVNALSTMNPLNFETEGTLRGQVLSAGSLQFDVEGNLFVGGSDFFGGGEFDYLALLQNDANGMGQLNFDPDTLAASFYNLIYNEVTGELYANEPFPLDEPIDNTAVFVIRPVPEPSSLALAVLGAIGVSWWWRRRRA
ncbi:MAG: PEP-CTERM sorting domain-containing protein [Pirellulales bacterium]|nr:PEP-CTERM sorting domain-containing protein [Pirellulales bacterium]